jgi:uncharacterized membrane protein
MRTIRQQGWMGRALLPVLVALQSLVGSAMAAAQTTAVKIDVNAKTNGGTMWYATWWFWVLVGLFVIIVIVAITSRGKRE